MVSNLLSFGKKSDTKSGKVDKEQIWIEKYHNPLAYNKNFEGNVPVRLTYDSIYLDNVDLVIRAAYKQVFGNVELMESERLPQIESQLRSGQITVKEFVGYLAKSPQYRTLFWENCSNLKAIELNFKHLLGRLPQNSREISQHIEILAERGFEAEIDSYLDSEEYNQNFGNTIVPYSRSYGLQTGKSMTVAFDSIFLLKAASRIIPSNIAINRPRLQTNLIQNQSNNIQPIRQISDSQMLPSEMINMRELKMYVYTDSNGRRPVNVDKKFIDMARNTPYHLR